MGTSLRIALETGAEDERPVFLAGTFNDWQAGQETYRMQQDIPGYYSYIFSDTTLLEYPMEFKFTRGTWKQVETDSYGGYVYNHKLEASTDLVTIHVPRWKMDGQFWNEKFLPIIETINEHFEIPQLITTRRISALLPWDYYQTDKHYPVLYLQDGQNLKNWMLRTTRTWLKVNT